MGIPALEQAPVSVIPREQALHMLHSELDLATGEHCTRVSEYVGLLSRFAGHDQSLTKRAAELAYIHDAGKAHPDIRHRLYSTDPEDIAFIKRNHVIYGAQRVKEMGLGDADANIILHHHEDNDGNGYPDGWNRAKTAEALGEEAATIIDLHRIADSVESMQGHYNVSGKPLDQIEDIIVREMQQGKYNKELEDPFHQLIAAIKPQE